MDINKNVEVMVKQVDCSRDRCLEILKKNDNDLMKSLEEYFNIKKKEEKPCKTSNQERYRLIRNIMDIH